MAQSTSEEHPENVGHSHSLTDAWTLWAHLPQDSDWSLQSYKEIFSFQTVEEALAILDALSPALIQTCMLFLMRKGIKPLYEDEKNCGGGAFSYKVMNVSVAEAWRSLFLVVVGETVSSSPGYAESVSGITISPKVNFCVIKIWLSNCNHKNAAVVTEEIQHQLLSPVNCSFKQHF
jgi:hypothetical protein